MFTKVKKYAPFALAVIAILLIVGGSVVQYLNRQAQVTQAEKQTEYQKIVEEPVLFNESDLSSRPEIGSLNAKNTIVIFSDYQCPWCRKYDQEMLPIVVKKYVSTKKAKVYFFHFAFLGKASVLAANAAEDVYHQDPASFFLFTSKVFSQQKAENKGWITEKLLVNDARQVSKKINIVELKKAIRNEKYGDSVSKDLRYGIKHGVTGTPSVFMNGYKLPNPFDLKSYEKHQK